MKKIIFVLLIISLFCFPLISESIADKVAKMGDAEWNKMIKEFKNTGNFVEGKTAAEVTKNIADYEGKYMYFPNFDFVQFVTDKMGEKYYYSRGKSSTDLFIIKYNDGLRDKFVRFGYVIGSLSDSDWELVGKIREAFTWWGNVVVMDIVAMRAKGKACAILKNGEVVFIGEDVMNSEIKKRAKNPYSDIPKNLKSVPKGLDPIKVAKLFYYVGGVEHNKDVWLQLVTKDFKSSSSRVSSLWRILNQYDRTYIYVRTVKDSKDEKKYYFQIQEKGQNLGDPKPITLKFEDGEWKVHRANP